MGSLVKLTRLQQLLRICPPRYILVDAVTGQDIREASAAEFEYIRLNANFSGIATLDGRLVTMRGNLTPRATEGDARYMARSLTDHELDAWLARNGYGHHKGLAAKMIRQEPTGREVYAAHERDGHLTTAGRRALRASQFALPPGPEEKRRGFKGRLPIHDSEHAHAALTRISQMHHLGHLSANQVAAAKRKIHKAWPSIEISHATKARTLRADELGHPDRIMINGKRFTVVSKHPRRLRNGNVELAVNSEYSTVSHHIELPADERVEVGWA